MPKKGWKTFSIRNDRLDHLSKIYQYDKNRPSNQEFGGWFDELLSQFCEYRQALKEHGPFLELKSTSENMLHLFDYKLKKSIDISINRAKKELQCETDKRNDCLHIGFCYAIPEAYKILIDYGFKNPKSSS